MYAACGRSFGSNLLKRVINQEENCDTNRQEVNAQDLIQLPKTVVSDLTSFLHDKWMNNGHAIFEWTCGMKAHKK